LPNGLPRAAGAPGAAMASKIVAPIKIRTARKLQSELKPWAAPGT
jgi:hypothetical protein